MSTSFDTSGDTTHVCTHNRFRSGHCRPSWARQLVDGHVAVAMLSPWVPCWPITSLHMCWTCWCLCGVQGVLPLATGDIQQLKLTSLDTEAPTCSSQQAQQQQQQQPTAGDADPTPSCSHASCHGTSVCTAGPLQPAAECDTAQAALSALNLAAEPVSNGNSSSSSSNTGPHQQQQPPADSNSKGHSSSSGSDVASTAPCGWLEHQLSGQVVCCGISCCNPEGALLVSLIDVDTRPSAGNARYQRKCTRSVLGGTSLSPCST
jgi:hypothetical protein